jgi:hypothetical protein
VNFIKQYKDSELLYAATARCKKCNAGLAYPLNHDEAFKLRAWVCSNVLKNIGEDGGHDQLAFAFWKVREETSINNRGRQTTRPPGTKCLSKGEATCPKCGTWWEGEPYSACGANHHWFSGPCPTCGYAVGAGGSHRSDEGPAIECRYKDVVVEEEVA